MVRLFIENQEIELTSNVQFAITRTFEDLSNPTHIINEWSKTVEIPFTAKNNYIFGNIFDPDRKTHESNSSNVFINFDPLKKMQFVLLYDDNILMQGYGKMNNITKKHGKGTYNITLFGELGKLFQEMQKITFDESTDDPTYLIDCAPYFTVTLNKENVRDSFESAGQSTPNLQGDYTNYIGFVPNNSFDSDFDYKTFQKDELTSDTFESALESVNFTDETGVEPSTVIPDGMMPREIGEYRSYMQQPFVYFNKLFKIFQAKAEALTGYTFNLDSNWFTTTNPYWFKLVYMLKKLDAANGNSYFNQYTDIRNNGDTTLVAWMQPSYDDYSEPHNSTFYMRQTIDEQKSILVGYNRLNIVAPTVLNLKLNTAFDAGVTSSSIKTNNGLLVTIKMTGENSHVESKKFLIVNENWSGSYSGATILRTTSAPTGSTKISVPTIDCYFSLDNDTFGDYVIGTYTVNWLYNSYPFQSGGAQTSTYYDILNMQSTASAKISGEHWARSGAVVTLNTFWNKEYNIFNEILNYCKMFRIGIFVNNFDKTITFKRFSQYFNGITIEDWSQLVDYSKDYTIKPVTFDSKYISFNYDDNQTKLGKQYKEQYGLNYGEIRIVTDYNFNDETHELFKGVKSPIINTVNVLSWTDLYSNKRIVYTLPAEKYVCLQDNNKKYVECFGQYYFHNGTIEWDDDSHLRGVVISDDTPFQQFNDTYFYAQSTNSVTVDSYPDLSLVYGSNLCTFNTPKENYTYNENEYTSKNSIFDNIWNTYISERYNKDNKIVTCHIFISPMQYAQFDFNHFVTIGNQLYMVNKIYDYDVTSSESTKVDLITVQDINKYKI